MCSIHVIFRLYPNMENQTQYSYSGVSYLAPRDTGHSHFTTEHFSLYESHPFAGYFLFNHVQSNVIVISNISSKHGFGFLLAYMNT